MHPVLVKLSFLTLHSYGMMMALAFVGAVAVCIEVGRRAGKSTQFITDLSCWVMVSGIIGARVAHVLANARRYMDDPITMLYLHQGGLVFYGGFIGAAVGMLLFAWRKHEKRLQLFDIVIVPVPLGHALGRIGCFLHGCCFGRETSGSMSVRFPWNSPAGWSQYESGHIPWERVRNLMRGFRQGITDESTFRDGLSQLASDPQMSAYSRSLPVFPVQLYEAAWNIVVFLVLFWFFKRRKIDGRVVALYMILYPIGRIGMELLRGDERMPAIGAINVAQLTSIMMIVVGSTCWLLTHVSERKENQCSG